MLIDTHSHLYLWELQNHIPEAIEHLRENDFSHTIQIGTCVETSRVCIDLAHTYDIVRATVGIHPCEAQDIPVEEIPKQIAELEEMIQKEKKYIVGFGEIGFDHYHLSSDTEEAKIQKSRQIEWFHAQADLAKKYDLPVVIHTRNCCEVTLDELRRSGLQKFVVHCFSEDWDFVEKIFQISPETRISFTGILTYPKSISIQDVAKKAPLNRIMLETDAPFLIPEALKNTVTYSEPCHTRYIFEHLCTLRDESKEKIEQEIWNNSVYFFHL